MSREIEELRAMAQRERTQVRELGAAWKDSAVDSWHSFARRHRGAAIAAALGAGYLGVRMLGGRSRGGGKKKRGLARASLGAIAALAAKALPAIAIHATSAFQRDEDQAPVHRTSTVRPGTSSGASAGPQRTLPRLPESTQRVRTP